MVYSCAQGAYLTLSALMAKVKKKYDVNSFESLGYLLRCIQLNLACELG